ncbi:hypothetical protein LJC04_05255 [Ruminococcaceae bacterium OttesenSCG-928-O06]|nr:hypothetical protein [Ruminococcaceae bacterium OttesenSCG-928-O06]
MKIEAYDVTAAAARSYTKVEMQSLSATIWGGGQVQEIGEETSNAGEGEAVVMSLSDLAQKMLEEAQEKTSRLMNRAQSGSASSIWGVQGQRATPMTKEELKLQMLDDLLFSMTGKRLNPKLRQIFSPGESPRGLQHGLAAGVRGAAGGEIRATTFTYEKETMAYNAKGVIKTADGKTLNVDISLAMSREFSMYTSSSLQFGTPQESAVDPLVINYGGTAASLSGEKFAFDLTMDGNPEMISFVGPGSGFLALDKNGDGTINDGSELFGPNTGSGFDELRAYDKDGNSWIDENDDIFSKLRVWSRDADGNDQLFTLQQLGIGAIYLGDVQTDFALTDELNNAHGYMRSTSFFLKEDGGAGTVSHIDLVV